VYKTAICYQHLWVPFDLEILARRAYAHADPAHGLDHVYRVLGNIERFNENRRRPLSALHKLLLACCALMHDARDHKTLQDPTRADLLLSEKEIIAGLFDIMLCFLEENPGAPVLLGLAAPPPPTAAVEEQRQDREENNNNYAVVLLILHVIETSSWSKRFHPASMMPLDWLMAYPAGFRREFFWLRDQLRAADMWEAIGHIGILRCEQVSIVRAAREARRPENSYRADDVEVVADVCQHIVEKLLLLSRAMTPELRALAEADGGPNSVLYTYLISNTTAAGNRRRLEELHKLIEYNRKQELLYTEARSAVERAIIGPVAEEEEEDQPHH